VAYAAVWRFAAAPAQAVPFLAEALRAVKAPTLAAVQRLIADLDNDEFKVRERATEELARHGDFVVDALKKAKSGDITLEQRRRIERLLEQLTGPAGGRERWRATRAVAALEQIGDAAARKVLADLAGGAADNGITREAKAAVERLKRSAK
jgi:hypothetical protein